MRAAARGEASPAQACAPQHQAGGDAAQALALYARVLAGASLQAAAHNLVAALVAHQGVARASFGLHAAGRTRLLASSYFDPSQVQGDLQQRLLGAMDEAIEQGVALCWPPSVARAAVHGVADGSGLALVQGAAGSGDVVVVAPAENTRAGAVPPPEDWICLEQRSLQAEVGGAVASIALGGAGEILGAVCVERDGAPFSAQELQRLQEVLLLVAPALRWMHEAGQPWYRRAWRESWRALAELRQPERRRTRRVLALAGLAVLLLACLPLPYEVAGRARVEGATQRVLSAPTDGFVKAAHVRPGDRVRAGDPLVDLIEGDLQLERARWTSQLEQHENAYAAAMSKSDRVAASTSMARVSEAQAQLALVDQQLARGHITAPFDAVVIQGDLSQSVGAPVRQGDSLLTLAGTQGFRVVVEIDETDIARVHAGQAGEMVLSSSPWERERLVVQRISPLAKAVDGRNVFEVEARLPEARADLRPGLIGRAQFTVGRMPPLWAWSRHALDRARMAWWAWLG